MKHSPFCPRFRPPARTGGFTLVEMLAVTGVIVVLTALTALSLRRSNGEMNRRTAVGNLMSVFDQARMTAISDGRPTYVVFASEPKSQSQDTSALTDTMWGRSYALFEDPIITDNTSTNSFSPVQRSAWMYLPVGVAFKCDSTADNTPASLTASMPASGDTTKFTFMPRTGTTQATLTLPYLKFDALGQIVDYKGNIVDANAACLRVLLFEGLASSASAELYTNRAAINSTDGKKYALEEIMLKPTTGRAVYTLNPLNNLAAATPKP